MFFRAAFAVLSGQCFETSLSSTRVSNDSTSNQGNNDMPKIEENDQTTHRHPEHQPDETRFRVIRSEEVIWRPFPPFPPAARIAILVGDPTREGLFVIRVKLSAGTKMLPHGPCT
jgi:hypothetical protein